jgi:hypothetical protein
MMFENKVFEENIWTKEKLSDRRVEKFCNEELFSSPRRRIKSKWMRCAGM